MKAVLLVLIGVALCHALPLGDESPVLDEVMIRKINSVGDWVAKANERFAGVTVGEAKQLLGAKINRGPKEHLRLSSMEAPVDLPASFDARQQWPNCIHPIRDQAQCGSCWAFGATEALSDRFCIASNGATDVIMSPEDLVSCDTADYGCEGGYLDRAWAYIKNKGVVSEKCFPYTAGGGVEAPCPSSNKCPGTGEWKKYHTSRTIQVAANEEAIKKEIYTNGPVEVAFEVYSDFMSYSSGVYYHQHGSFLGGHAVKMLGWGTYQGTKYWLCANSWGPTWGMKGFFMIRRGVDECSIEDDVICGDPLLKTENIVDLVNNDDSLSWKAERNLFTDMPEEQLKGMMGTIIDEPATTSMPVVKHSIVDLPATFDAREKWPECVHAIRDQGQCGSCWAFGATEAFSDRLCVGGGDNVVLSPQMLVSCDKSDMGCNGGWLETAWAYMTNPGVVSEACYPYTSGGGSSGTCQTKCKDGSPFHYYRVKQGTVQVMKDVDTIANAIYNNGPVEAAFYVYSDFMSYSSGVYVHKYGGFLGGHAIKILGWGHDAASGLDYWICANSWGTSWGQKGIFWIAKGQNECNIEKDVVAGLPDV